MQQPSPAPAAGSSTPGWSGQGQGFGAAAPNPGQAPGQGFGTPFDNEDRTILRSAPAPQAQGRLGIVRIEEGKEPGRVYEVRKDSLSIGRSRESDIFLEDLAVSRLHASIVNLGNGNYALRDEGSANGTKVNGQTVNKDQPYPLQEGDKIQLGQTVLVFARR
jgi:pSer/pThr/pTyr-binding forkhead associated (FHA) protein